MLEGVHVMLFFDLFLINLLINTAWRDHCRVNPFRPETGQNNSVVDVFCFMVTGTRRSHQSAPWSPCYSAPAASDSSRWTSSQHVYSHQIHARAHHLCSNFTRERTHLHLSSISFNLHQFRFSSTSHFKISSTSQEDTSSFFEF